MEGSGKAAFAPIPQTDPLDGGHSPTAAMEIGDDVNYRGRVLVLLGHDPMSVPDRHAQVADRETGERFDVLYDELEPLPASTHGFDRGFDRGFDPAA
jgi:hypothetical protein